MRTIYLSSKNSNDLNEKIQETKLFHDEKIIDYNYSMVRKGLVGVDTWIEYRVTLTIDKL